MGKKSDHREAFQLTKGSFFMEDQPHEESPLSDPKLRQQTESTSSDHESRQHLPRAAPISVATLNVDGIRSNSTYLQHIVNQSTITCIQEHWLHNYEKHTIQSIVPNTSYTIKCYDDDNPISNIQRTRGMAGVAIWSKDVDHLVKPLHDGSSRLVAVQLQTSPPLTIINTYMPTEGSHDSSCTYEEILDEVHVTLEKYSASGPVIWAGDLNACFNRTKYTNDKKLQRFCQETALTPPLKSCTTPAYHHFNGFSAPRVDHVLEHQNNRVLQEHYLNCGNHDAIIARTDLVFPKPNTTKVKMDPAIPRPRWDKADLELYKKLTEERLRSLENLGGSDLHPHVLAECLHDILAECALKCGATKRMRRTGKKRSGKHPWDPRFSVLAQASKDLHQQLKHADEQHAKIKKKLRKAKQRLRSSQRQLAISSEEHNK